MTKNIKTVTKRTLVRAVAETTGATHKSTQEAIQRFLELISQTLSEGNRLEFRDFGVFELVLRKAKQGRNLNNNTPLTIPAHSTVKFTPGRKLLDQIADKEKRSKK